MNRLAFTILVNVLLSAVFAHGQTDQPDPHLSSDSADTLDLNWDSVNRRTYFIQFSTNHSLWNYFPVTELGDDLPIAWTIDTTETGNRLLLRLQYTDIATTEPDLSDFDGDGIGNLAELWLPGEDPLTPHGGSGDTDSDGMPDLLELHYFGNLNKSGEGDEDQDGISNALELQAGQNPASNQTTNADARTNYTYDVMGRLEAAVHGSDTDSVDSFYPLFDAEGNLLARE